jgi:hypothetical protein
MGNLVSLYYDTITAMNQDLFNGSTASIALLTTLIANGQMMEPGTAGTEDAIRGFFEKSIYGVLIPQAWSLSNKGIHPFVLDSGSDCSDIDVESDYMTSKTATATSYCYNNKLYYLVSTTGGVDCSGNPCGVTETCNGRFTAPAGLSELNGTAWGGVTLEDFVVG